MAQISGDGADAITLDLEEVEVALLASLAHQLLDFVVPESQEDEDPLVALVGIDPQARTPDDPALQRLFPDAYPDDAAASSDFRRFTERDLRAAKADNARRVLAALEAGPGPLRITPDDAPAWLGFLNDTRLTIGTRLDITEDNHELLEELPEDDPRSMLYQVYDWLTFVQESIVQWRLATRFGG